MDNLTHRFLLSEQGELERLLAMTPEEDVIDRLSLQSRLDAIQSELTTQRTPLREPVHARLTFSGKPVVGSHGILVDFCTSMMEKFSDTVSSFAASIAAPLSPNGPIPNRNKHGLLITGTARGSFGFELEESSEFPQLDLDVPSPVETALEQTITLMQASIESDDDTLSEKIADQDPRAIKVLHDFIENLAKQNALCALTVGNRSFRFQFPEDVQKSASRLSQENLHEEEQDFSGIFLGVLPERRDFEFRVSPDNTIIRGKIGRTIERPANINQCLEKNSIITTQATWAGNAKPRYTLLRFNVVS